MKINKNVVLEYLYLTIFVITLFVLKELIEYVFFTRKKHNVMERFFDNSPVCSRIAHYHDKYDDLKKLIDSFNIQDDGSCLPRIKVKNYVEIKNLDPGNNVFTRIILKPDISAIYFEKIIYAPEATQLAVALPKYQLSYGVSIMVNNSQLEFSKYNYDGNIDQIFNTKDFNFDFIDFSIGYLKNKIPFAVFDITNNYEFLLNKSLQDLIDKHE